MRESQVLQMMPEGRAHLWVNFQVTYCGMNSGMVVVIRRLEDDIWSVLNRSSNLQNYLAQLVGTVTSNFFHSYSNVRQGKKIIAGWKFEWAMFLVWFNMTLARSVQLINWAWVFKEAFKNYLVDSQLHFGNYCCLKKVPHHPTFTESRHFDHRQISLRMANQTCYKNTTEVAAQL